MTTKPLVLLRARASVRNDRGASAVEYGLLIAGIAALIAVAVYAFGGGVDGLFQDSCNTIRDETSVGSCS
jgi:pilus assembly protein Flp/PilA